MRLDFTCSPLPSSRECIVRTSATAAARRSPLLRGLVVRAALVLVAALPSAVHADQSAGLPVASSQLTAEEVSRMSIDELMDLEVISPAAITSLTAAQAPASITVITADDIKSTPSRNIYDLIETYVPGATWYDSENGPALGIRGNITGRNYRFLLRVNDRLMNSKGRYGAKSELEQWDLNDIQRIEVIRGPGSVTYGPGAVAGVINIYTKNASTADGTEGGVRYVNQYDSKGAYLSHLFTGEKLKTYVYGAVTATDGDNARHFLGDDGDGLAGFVGQDIRTDTEPLDYFGDYQEHPQVKLHVDSTYGDSWRFWVRYTQEGSHWRGNEAKTEFDGSLQNQEGLRDRQITGVAEYEDKLSDDISLTTTVSVDSLDTERRGQNVRHPDPGNALNFRSNFAESELFARTILNWRPNESTEVAAGAEYSLDYYGRGWGDSKNDMRLGEESNIVSGPDSNALAPGMPGSADRNDTAVFVGDGWSTDSVSLFAEGKQRLTEQLSVLLSARIDDSTYIDPLISPRVAFLASVTPKNHLKLIMQRSVRENAAEQVYNDFSNNRSSDDEVLNSVELIYSYLPSNRLHYNLSAFYNDAEVVGDDEDLNRTLHIGDLETFGVETDVSYRDEGVAVGASYAFARQSHWSLKERSGRNGVSYSDSNLELDHSDAVLHGVGNDLNNWPNHSIKVYGRYRVAERVTLHSDMRFFWDYQGALDGLEALARAVEGFPEEPLVAAQLERVDREDAYDYDFRFNASISFSLTDDAEISLFVQNLFSANDAKRYSYDIGNDDPSATQVRFVEEPRVLGIRVDFHL